MYFELDTGTGFTEMANNVCQEIFNQQTQWTPAERTCYLDLDAGDKVRASCRVTGDNGGTIWARVRDFRMSLTRIFATK